MSVFLCLRGLRGSWMDQVMSGTSPTEKTYEYHMVSPARKSRKHMGVSKNNGTPKSSILIGFSIINHPFWCTPIFGNIHILTRMVASRTIFQKKKIKG